MADYLIDSESQDIAILSGTYTTDTVNKVTTFGSDGQADTGYTLPSDSEWYLIEVFNVEGVSGDIGYTVWKSNKYNMAAEMVDARTTASAEYTTYDITCTHYKGDNTADIYRGDESTALALASIDTGIPFTPSGVSWKITDTPTAIYPDIVTDGAMANGQTYWTAQNGWNWSDISWGEMHVYNTSGGSIRNYADTDEALVAGQQYRMTIEITDHTSGTFRFFCGNASSGWFYSAGTKSALVTNDGINNVSIQFLDGCTLTADNFSVRKED